MKKKIVLIAGGTIMLALLGFYIHGVNYYSKHYYPKTTIRGINCGKMTPKESWKKIQEKTKSYKIEVITRGDSVHLTNENGKLLQINDNNKDMKTILSYQNPLLWPIERSKEEDYGNVGHFIPNEDTIKAELTSVLDPKEKVKSKDAKLKYDPETKQYRIIEDTVGNIVDQEKVLEGVKKSIEQEEETSDIKDFYKRAKITKDSEKLLKAKEKLDKYLRTTIHYSRAGHELTLNADKIHDFLCWNKKFKTWINEDQVKEYVKSNIAKEFTTMGKEREIDSPGSGKIKISGGNYGYVVSIDNETKELLSDLKKGEEVTRPPKYYQTARSEEGNEIGDTYIDVSIADQELWYIKNGKVKLHSNVVTGDPTTGHATPKGTYYVEFKTTNYTFKRYNSHADYWMPIDTSTGVGLHDATWRSNFGGSIYKGNGSHGCINLPHSFAKKLYGVVEEGLNHGTPVIVH